MALQSFIVDQFQGWNLRDDPTEIGPGVAFDLSNVVLNDGRIRPRAGTTVWASKVAADVNSWTFLYALNNANRILTSTNGTIEVRDSVGAVVATQAGGDARTAVDVATAAQSAGTYVGVAGVGARFIDSAGAITVPAFTGHTPSSGILGVTSKTFRLVSTDGAHRVFFSNAGDPLTFDVNNQLDLWPNDSEAITYIATWRDLVFVFKKTKFAVFYGESTDDDNTTTFDYYGTYNIPAINFTGGKPVAVGRDGIYYFSREGVYFTTGGKPERVSGPIDPLFLNLPSDSVTQPPGKPDYTLSLSNPWLHYDQDMLYVAYPNTYYSVGSPYVAVLDIRRGAWSQWSIVDGITGPGVVAMISQPTGSATSNAKVLYAATPFANLPGANPDWNASIVTFTDTTVTDNLIRTNGSALASSPTWYYAGGYVDFKNPGMKRLRYTDLYGDITAPGAMFLAITTSGRRVSSTTTMPGAALSLTANTGETIKHARSNTPSLARMFTYRVSAVGAGYISRIEFRYTDQGDQ